MAVSGINRKGFCRGCIQNTRHLRRFRSRLFNLLDLLILRSPSLFQLGPWNCSHCGQVKFFLSSPVKGVRDFEADALSDDKAEEELPIGNILKQQSLVSADENRDRFSEKYRHGVAQKLLRGQTLISRLAREINVDESELQVWIREFVEYQQAQIVKSLISSGSLDAPSVQRLAPLSPEHASAEQNGSNQPVSAEPAPDASRPQANYKQDSAHLGKSGPIIDVAARKG